MVARSVRQRTQWPGSKRNLCSALRGFDCPPRRSMRRSLVKRTGHDTVTIRLLLARTCLRDARAGWAWLSSDREQRSRFQCALGILVCHRGADHSSSCLIRTAGQTASGVCAVTVLVLQTRSWFLYLGLVVELMRRPACLAFDCRPDGRLAVISHSMCAVAQTDGWRCAILHTNPAEQDMTTEAQLRRDVIDEMAAEPLSDVDRLDVEVRDGTGCWIEQVGNCAEKSVAERAAYRAPGARPK